MMRTLIFSTLTCAALTFMPGIHYGQAPDLGLASSFAVFTAVGAFTNDGNTVITGDIGTNVGMFSGFPPGMVIGQIHVEDGVSAQVAPDVQEAYSFLAGLTCGTVIGTTLGNNQILTPDIYCMGAASNINGTLILDAEGDPDAIFIFQIDGALSTGVLDSVVLINSASICNVYWQVNGAFSLGEGSEFRGTLIANGAIHLLEGSSLQGRALSTAGAVDLHNNVVMLGSPSIAATIVADGPTDLCEGEVVILSGNIDGTWNTGETTATISVSTSGNFFVVNATSCGNDTSNVIIVTVNPLPECTITGGNDICQGQTTELCAPAGASQYLWSTGDITDCIFVNAAGTYTVTVTDGAGCSSTCSETVIVSPDTPPLITCPSDVTIECTASTLPSNTGSASATDDCTPSPVIGYTDLIVAGPCPQEYSIIRTWRATDDSGNSSICTQEIIIEDNSAPFITCTANVEIECDESSLPLNTGFAFANDNCNPKPDVNFSDLITAGACSQEYVITRTWTAMDACGNSAACTQLITVSSNTPPQIVFINPLLESNGDTAFIQCYGQNPEWDLPEFDESSISATGNCGGIINVEFTQTLENEGNCLEDGYINLYRLTWTATDECGNGSNAFAFLALVDTIPPVIHGIPLDITISCNSIPEPPDNIYATDECLCACVMLLDESPLPTGCMDGLVMVRSWSATDRCGNETILTQNITLVVTEGPRLSFHESEMTGMTDGTILEFNCSEGGIPDYIAQLNAESLLNTVSCGGLSQFTFNRDIEVSNHCDLSGFMEQHTFHWEGVDECGNISTMTIFARLIDDEAPVLSQLPDTACIGDPLLNYIEAIDNCSETTIHTFDFQIPNPCGNGTAIRRMYEAYDECGNMSVANVILIPDDQSQPVLTFINPILSDVISGDGIIVNCDFHNQKYTSFDVHDIRVEDVCIMGVSVQFTETLIHTGDCTTDGYIAQVELKWTAEDLCGNTSVLILMANIVDQLAPVFENFNPEIAIGCHDELPQVITTDNCGEVSVVTSDSIIPGDCILEYDVRRTVTATDPCGNTSIGIQIIHVGNGSGPVITGVELEICDDLSIPVVTAWDACAEVFVPVTMHQDTVEGPCSEGLIIRRSWSAVDICGNESIVYQTIIINDHTPPEIIISAHSVIKIFTYNDQHVILISDTDLLNKLNNLNVNSVFFIDECDLEIIPVFSVDTMISADCAADGYYERRSYTWTATDICGNTSAVTFNVDIVDDIPPVFTVTPPDTTIVCAPLPVAPSLLALDPAQPVIINYSESMVPGDQPGVFIITRKWIATDACGNTSVHIQVITWIPDTFLECNIILPESIECNSHGVVILSEVFGGIGSIDYYWEIVGEKCFIQGGQGTPEIEIYVGWSDVKIILTVTDEFGCVSMCMIFLNCLESGLNSLSTLVSDAYQAIDPDQVAAISSSLVNIRQDEILEFFNVWPNPAHESLNISFESVKDLGGQYMFVNFLGQVVLTNDIYFSKGISFHKIDVALIPEGNYLLQVSAGNEVHSKIVAIMHKK